MKITYNQIIDTFRGFAEAHNQISEFANGDLWEVVQHDKLTDFTYPLMFVTDAPATLGDGEITMSFQVLVMDRADENIENEVKSDTLLTLLDTVAYFEKLYAGNWKFVTIQKSSTSSTFTERFDDTLTGWSIGISLKMPLQYDECQIPYSGHTPGFIDCNPATITDGLSTIEVPSGGSYTCTSGGASVRVSNSNDSYDVNTSIDLELPNIDFTDSDGVTTSVPSMENLVCTLATNDIDLKFNFNQTADTSNTETITAFEAGTYTSIADDGASGTITVSINGGAFVAFSTLNPLTLVVSDTIAFKRTTTTSAGYTQITGTY